MSVDRPGCDLRRKEAKQVEGERDRAAEIMRLWQEGFGPGQIAWRTGYRYIPGIVKVLLANGVAADEIQARRVKKAHEVVEQTVQAAAEDATLAEDTRVTDFDPVGDEVDEEQPEATPEGIIEATVAWLTAARERNQRERERLQKEAEELEAANELLLQFHHRYGFSASSAKLAQTLRHVTEERLESLKEAS